MRTLPHHNRTVRFQTTASSAQRPPVRSQIRPLIGILSRRSDRPDYEIPIGITCGPRVRAPPTFRRLTASETLNECGLAGFRDQGRNSCRSRAPWLGGNYRLKIASLSVVASGSAVRARFNRTSYSRRLRTAPSIAVSVRRAMPLPAQLSAGPRTLVLHSGCAPTARCG